MIVDDAQSASTSTGLSASPIRTVLAPPGRHMKSIKDTLIDLRCWWVQADRIADSMRTAVLPTADQHLFAGVIRQGDPSGSPLPLQRRRIQRLRAAPAEVTALGRSWP